jgi:soluble lytic murein transglycosylase-like protein
MDLFAEINAVRSRIAEITGTPPPQATTAGAFGAALESALHPGTPLGPTAGGAAADAPAPVPPGEIDALVNQNAAIWQVDPALIKAVIANESGFNANATSPVGAQGLMQLMPETAAALGVRNPYDPAQNVAGGTRYLRSMLDRFGGDARLAIAAYNAGPGAVEKYGDVPPYAETKNYVQNVLGSAERYRAP